MASLSLAEMLVDHVVALGVEADVLGRAGHDHLVVAVREAHLVDRVHVEAAHQDVLVALAARAAHLGADDLAADLDAEALVGLELLVREHLRHAHRHLDVGRLHLEARARLEHQLLRPDALGRRVDQRRDAREQHCSKLAEK